MYYLKIVEFCCNLHLTEFFCPSKERNKVLSDKILIIIMLIANKATDLQRFFKLNGQFYKNTVFLLDDMERFDFLIQENYI